MLQYGDGVKIAEIGIGRRGSFVEIFKTIPNLISEYIAIDPFIPELSTGSHSKKSKSTLTMYYQEACEFASLFPQLSIIKATSPEITTSFKDDYFDLVFIDGDHSHEGVKADIEAWSPKIKSWRGFLTGHDYNHNEPGVVKAVDEAFGENFIIIKRVWIHQKQKKFW